MALDGWLKTWQDRVGAALIAAIAAVLIVLALMGYEIAFASLILLLGTLLGHVVVYWLSVPLRGRFARRFGAWTEAAALASGFVLGIALVLAGLLLVGLPSLSSDGGSSTGTLVYGLALGLPSGLRSALAPKPQPTPEEARQSRQAALRGSLILGGALVFLFSLISGLYLLLEYVAAPLIRYFAG